MSLLKTMALMSRSHHSLDLLSGPPPEVQEAVAAAWERAQEPLVEDLRLGFGSEPLLRRAWGELRAADGTLLQCLRASEAVAIACGDAGLRPAPALAV